MNLKLLIPAAVIALVLLAYLFTDSVRFTESAVVTTFGKASEGAVREEPGLLFKLPLVNDVTKYDKRARVLRTRSLTQQTADSRPLIVQSFCVWRVSDPLKFFQSFGAAGQRSVEHYRKAENEVLRDSLRSATSAVSNYRMDQLFTSDRSVFPQLESDILAGLKGTGAAGTSLGDYGIEVLYVGISKALLPEQSTQAVFDRMRANRNALVRNLETQGEAEAAAIISQAENDAKRIRSFAEARAQEIRSLGDLEAQPYLAQLAENPELAVFLRNMEFIRDVYAKKVTLVFPDSTPGLGVLSPSVGANMRDGEVPGVAFARPLGEAIARSNMARNQEMAREMGGEMSGAGSATRVSREQPPIEAGGESGGAEDGGDE
jgi:membrane protease subunit HflC